MSQKNQKESAKRHDLTGRRFGKLTALEMTGEKKNGYNVWRCRCDCGNEVLLPSRYLRNGWRGSCGCEKKTRYRDLTGQRFGKLQVTGVALAPDAAGESREMRTEDGRVMWDCVCDCGKRICAPGSQLIAGYRRSCGCLSKPEQKDWIGQRFGKLTVQSYAGKWNGVHRWNCLCDCGNETVVSQSNLMNGHTNSCGCLADPSHTRTLIEGTCIESIRSKKLFVTNTSGVRGVYRVKKSGKWAAQIMFKGRQKYLGTFNTLQEAAAARQEAEHVYEEFLERYDNSKMTGEDSCSIDTGTPQIKKWAGIPRHSAEQGLATSL